MVQVAVVFAQDIFLPDSGRFHLVELLRDGRPAGLYCCADLRSMTGEPM
jgi:hypothetical protein